MQDIIQILLANHDWLRALRMTSYGFLFYGPGSYVWYQTLDRYLPQPTVQNLLTKVLFSKTLTLNTIPPKLERSRGKMEVTFSFPLFPLSVLIFPSPSFPFYLSKLLSKRTVSAVIVYYHCCCLCFLCYFLVCFLSSLSD